MSHAIATEETKDKFKTTKRNGETVKLPLGRETIRSARCPQHHRTSTTFEGVNGSGWIFACSGTPRVKDSAHRFIAEPPDVYREGVK